MKKIKLKPQAAVGPVPAALISCGGLKGEKNIITLAWVGMVNSTPPMLSISVRPSRYSYHLIMATKEFVVNIPSSTQAEVVEQCGIVSGAKVDKFAQFNLTPISGSLQYAPLIEECPISIECTVAETMQLPSHDLFVGEIKAVWTAPEYCAGEMVDFSKVSVLGFANGYYLQTDFVNVRGFTVQKKG
ncbi:MAG: flavin reductase family protein [bacterium]|jgi:flavin reductase (DIM6/NTAB) family NADH-FMN oxidoreductase RutF